MNHGRHNEMLQFYIFIVEFQFLSVYICLKSEVIFLKKCSYKYLKCLCYVGYGYEPMKQQNYYLEVFVNLSRLSIQQFILGTFSNKCFHLRS